MNKVNLVERSLKNQVGIRPSTLAVAISSALMVHIAGAQDDTVKLDTLSVEEEVSPDTNPYAEPGASYLANEVSDPRRTRPLAETPQTITVLTQEQITDTGRSDLRDILDAQPGITLGTGENGNAFGDRYVIRGHEARSDVFVDGLRDPGMTVRESFAVEQVEITKGPSSTFAGRGSTGGAINSATKRASTEFDFTKLSAGIGTSNHHRLVLDTNIGLSFDTALRINLLHTGGSVPNREPADRERMGGALSLVHQPTDDLELTFDFYHFDADETPDLGTYIESLGGGNFGKPVNNIPVYLQNEDFLESVVDTGTVRVGYEFSPSTRLVNLTRYGVTKNGYLLTGARGGTAYTSEQDALAAENGYASIGLSSHQGWQEVDYVGNQLSLISEQLIGNHEHDFVLGLGYSDQRVLNGLYVINSTSAENCWAQGNTGVTNAHCIINPDGSTVDDIHKLLQRGVTKGDWDSDWNVRTVSVSAMDTVALGSKWDVFAGLRYDYYDYKTLAYFDPDGRQGPAESELTNFTTKDGFFNGHIGVTYSFSTTANVYASVSTATNINGGESDVGTSCGYGGICVDGTDIQLGGPEETYSVELGTKWKLFGGKLLATGSLFQITKNDVMEQSTGDSYSTLGTLNTGQNQVQGIELGVAGNISDKISVQAGISIASFAAVSGCPVNRAPSYVNVPPKESFLVDLYLT